MCLVLLRRQRASHLEHVHIVVVALAAIGREVEVLLDDALHRAPGVVDVARGAPREGGAVDPCAGIGPSAGIHAHIRATGILDGVGNGGVAFLLVEHQVVFVVIVRAAAEVHLDEVKATLLEEEVGVLLVVFVEAHALTRGVAVEHRAAGVAASIAVDARLQSLLVYIVCHGLQSLREARGVYEQMAVVLVAPAEVAVVDVDVVVAHGAQSLADHRIGLALDNTLADVHTKGVPRAPAHRRAVLPRSRASRHQGNR